MILNINLISLISTRPKNKICLIHVFLLFFHSLALYQFNSGFFSLLYFSIKILCISSKSCIRVYVSCTIFELFRQLSFILHSYCVEEKSILSLSYCLISLTYAQWRNNINCDKKIMFVKRRL